MAVSSVTPDNGAAISASGVVSPWVAGTQVSLQHQVGAANWATVSGIAPDSSGRYSVRTSPQADSANRYRVVVAERGYFTGAISQTVAVTPRVPSATGFTAVPGSPNVGIELDWNAVPAASNGKNVLIRREPGTIAPASPTQGTAVATLPISAVTYTDSAGLSAGTTYSYSLFVQDTAGVYSAPVSTQVTVKNPPALTWAARIFPQPITGNPSYIGCTSATFCMLLGYRSYQTWNGANWTTAQMLPQISTGQGAMTCAPPSFCMWVGHDAALTYDAGTWSGAVPVPALGPNDSPNSVSCTSPTFCIAVTFDGNTELWNGSIWSLGPPFGKTGVGYGDSVWCASPSMCWTQGGDQWNGSGWSEVQSANGAGGYSIEVSCASPTFCVQANDVGQMSSYSGGAWSQMISPWPSAPQDYEVRIDCPSSTFCISTASDSSRDALVATWNGMTWTAPATLHTSVRNPIIGCPTSASCMEVDSSLPHLNGRVTTYSGGTWGSSQLVTPANEIQEVSCVSGGTCHTTDYAGNVRTFDGTTWGQPTAVDPASGVTSISCGTDTFCAVVDDTGGAAVETGGSWGARQIIAPNSWLTSVSCTSDGACMALTQTGQTYQYAAGTWSETSTGPNGAGTVACGSAPYCTVDGYWWNGAIWQQMPENNGRSATIGTCVGPTSCVITFGAPQGGAAGAARFNNGVWASPPIAIADPTTWPPGDSPIAVACETPTQCVARDGDRWNEFTPTSFTDGVLQNTIFNAGDFYLAPSVSCTGPNLCVGIADGGVDVGRGP